MNWKWVIRGLSIVAGFVIGLAVGRRVERPELHAIVPGPQRRGPSRERVAVQEKPERRDVGQQASSDDVNEELRAQPSSFGESMLADIPQQLTSLRHLAEVFGFVALTIVPCICA